jgi:bifunctional DNA-binding transcriptional regulator/antitoxin component of YhaV-PrlF toxin-antitoxin module
MPQLADDPKVNALKVSSQGQVTLSKEARDLLDLGTGQTVIELSMPGCIILLPQSTFMADLMKTAQRQLNAIGLNVDQLKSNVEKRKQDRLAKRYPGVFNER